ncbi:MAG: PilT/PilU family type 4a pilus ATPase [bacterium]
MASEYAKKFEELVELMLKEDASDLHLSEDRQPMIRVAGSLIPMVKYPALTKSDMKSILELLLDDSKKQIFEDTKSVDLAYSHNEKTRFRCNVFMRIGKISLAMRLIPRQIKTIEELRLPSIIETFTTKQQGFFLVVGPTGHGKSTTLASLIEMINERRLEHIITIEDPIEYLFESKKSVIDQREILQDSPDFHKALKDMFREDVDVLMVGEMRDPETMSTAVTAAETGHLVFSTLHTNTAAQTVSRIIDSFSTEQQDQIRVQLSASLLGIFSQRLVPRVSGGLIPACELLINNTAVANLIRENRTHELESVIETSSDQGMINLNKYLAELVSAGEITIENAYLYSSNPKSLERML